MSATPGVRLSFYVHMILTNLQKFLPCTKIRIHLDASPHQLMWLIPPPPNALLTLRMGQTSYDMYVLYST